MSLCLSCTKARLASSWRGKARPWSLFPTQISVITCNGQHTCLHTHIHTHTRAHTHTRTHTRACTHIHTHTHTHTHTQNIHMYHYAICYSDPFIFLKSNSSQNIYIVTDCAC